MLEVIRQSRFPVLWAFDVITCMLVAFAGFTAEEVGQYIALPASITKLLQWIIVYTKTSDTYFLLLGDKACGKH